MMGKPMMNMLRSSSSRRRITRKPLKAIIDETMTKMPPITGAGIDAISMASLLDRPKAIIQKAQP